MTNLVITDPKESITRDLSVLREYAGRAVVHGEELAPSEAADQAWRMEEFLAVGRSFNLTFKEMVLQIYNGLDSEKRDCGCHSCRSMKKV
ncbi:MAG: hypothetical protein J4O03_11255 [Chloroflexi bacterium]|nr:hypothetical protein [Chloroflexota bacterium]MCI0866350.1 hypothetical protein [Chloroflexota bacterium]